MKIQVSLSKEPVTKKPKKLNPKQQKAHDEKIKKVRDQINKLKLSDADLQRRLHRANSPDQKEAITKIIRARKLRLEALKVTLSTLMLGLAFL